MDINNNYISLPNIDFTDLDISTPNITTVNSYNGLQTSLEIFNEFLNCQYNNINYKDKYGDTALIVASTKGNSFLVRKILNYENVNINVTDIDGNTALILALMNNNLDIVNILLNHIYINIDTKNEKRQNALDIAIEKQYLNIILLIKNLQQKRQM